MASSPVKVEKKQTLTGHRDCIYTLEAGSDGKHFYSGGGDGLVAEWDLSDPENGRLLAKLPASVYGLHHMPQTNTLVVGQNFEGIHLVDLTERKEKGSLRFTTAAIFDLTSHGNRLFAATGDGVLTVIDLEHLQVIKKITLSDKSVRSLSVNPDTRELAAGLSDNTIRILDLTSLEEKKRLADHTKSVFTVRYSPDNRYLLSGSRDAHLKVWDAEAGYALADSIVAHMYAINNVTYSPDGRHFVTCSMDKSIKIWDAAAFRLLKVIDKARHAGHGTSVNKLLWAGLDNRLVSCSDDRTISVWDIEFNDGK
ncbi:WD40 repeat domain-containing protein [Roseivirga sp. BDSF3-8]|uniref:WD40 repeat domain-containing protein n=1 Tax=Roseivirga sp. BDSF3-8 TaxID=3241598 RepID=UPI00353232FA